MGLFGGLLQWLGGMKGNSVKTCSLRCWGFEIIPMGGIEAYCLPRARLCLLVLLKVAFSLAIISLFEKQVALFGLLLTLLCQVSLFERLLLIWFLLSLLQSFFSL